MQMWQYIATSIILMLVWMGLFEAVGQAQDLEVIDCSQGIVLVGSLEGTKVDCPNVTGGKLTITAGLASTLNPITTADSASGTIQFPFFGIWSLLAIGPPGLEPQVASLIEVSEDGTTISYTLRDGVVFSDGVSVTTEDILYWYHDVIFNPHLPNSAKAVFTCPDTGAPMVVTAISPTVINIQCPSPFRTFTKVASFLPVFSKQMALDLIADQGIPTDEGVTGPRTTQEFLGLGANLDLIRGLGPFRMTTFDSDSLAVYERNEHFYQVDSEGTRLPYLDRLERPVSATGGFNFALTSFLSGQTDLTGLRPSDIAPILGQAASGGFKVNSDIDNGTPNAGTQFVTINFDDQNAGIAAAARNTNARRALSLAIDRISIVNNVLLGIGVPQYLPMTLSGDAFATFFVGRNNTCASFAMLDAPCDDTTGIIRVRSDVEIQVTALPPLGLTPELDQHLNCLVDMQSCWDLANDLLDQEGFVDTNGNGIRNLPDGSEWQMLVTTNSGNTLREGFTQVICDGWIQLHIECSANSTTFATLVAQLLGLGGATWTGAIVIGLGGGDPAGGANVFQCGANLYFWHKSCDPDATEGPTMQDSASAVIEAAFDAGFSATSVEDAQTGFDQFQNEWSKGEPYFLLAVRNQLFAVRIDRICNDLRMNSPINIIYRVDLAGNEGTCSTNENR